MASPSTKADPVYQTQKPNENVLLYEGPLQFEKSSEVAHGDGAVKFNWLPWPRICFEMSIATPAGDVCGAGVLTTPDGRFRCNALVNLVRLSADSKTSPKALRFFDRIAVMARRVCEYVAISLRLSPHWRSHTADIGGDGPSLILSGQLSVIGGHSRRGSSGDSQSSEVRGLSVIGGQ